MHITQRTVQCNLRVVTPSLSTWRHNFHDKGCNVYGLHPIHIGSTCRIINRFICCPCGIKLVWIHGSTPVTVALNITRRHFVHRTRRCVGMNKKWPIRLHIKWPGILATSAVKDHGGGDLVFQYNVSDSSRLGFAKWIRAMIIVGAFVFCFKISVRSVPVNGIVAVDVDSVLSKNRTGKDSILRCAVACRSQIGSPTAISMMKIECVSIHIHDGHKENASVLQSTTTQ
mmetsp:Transcript_10420/g.15024  ORF Transcript_10420/g.15024 Transcript_10420/m.15024 type:complete len:228 (+) Transcript_10420:874-1557(+)